MEGYARSLLEPDGPWAGFAQSTVEDWLGALANSQPPAERESPEAVTARTSIIAGPRGALLDLLATEDVSRTTAAVDRHPRAMERMGALASPTAGESTG